MQDVNIETISDIRIVTHIYFGNPMCGILISTAFNKDMWLQKDTSIKSISDTETVPTCYAKILALQFSTRELAEEFKFIIENEIQEVLGNMWHTRGDSKDIYNQYN